MSKIPVGILRAGLSFSEPVYIEDSNVLVPAGMAIRKKDLDRLLLWGIETVETEGEILLIPPAETDKPRPEADSAKTGDPLTEPEDGVSDQIHNILAAGGTHRVYVNLIEQLDSIFEIIKSGASPEVFTENAGAIRKFRGIVSILMQIIQEQRAQVLGYILEGEAENRELAKSSVNIAVLSALIAGELGTPRQGILKILTGALLHDVGMLKLPKEVLHKNGGLSPAELRQIRIHPLYAYKLICNGLLYPEGVGLTALQHHERWDGGGYPQRLEKGDIETGARIVSVADAFEAMISKKPYRNSMIGYQAMKNLMADNHRRFDPEILKVFIKIMGVYPIGSMIRLNNGAAARVTAVQQDAPLRPQIRLIQDGSGKLFKQGAGPLIDLLTEKSLFIARAMDPKEFARDRA
jgi:HD-GYP domain-containing protein (c-di-GMP phosphodiesterase class II)